MNWDWLGIPFLALTALGIAGPLVREIASFLRRRGLLERLSNRLGSAAAKKLHITLPNGDELELTGFSEKDMRAVLDRVAPALRSDTERLVREAAEREEAERRLADYTRRRGEAEYWLGPYLPANVRRAKRLINHERLYVMIAEDRGVFGGTPPLTHQHLAKWVLIVEHWPRLGAALVRDPSLIDGLERADQVPELQGVLDSSVPGVQASEDLLRILRDGVPLGRVLSRLVRFEPADSERA
jgi:hypothetical protein